MSNPETARDEALDELAREAQANGDYDPPGCEHLRRFINEQGAEIKGLRAAHAELLAALKEVVRISDRKHDAWDRAHAVITKVEGYREQ